MDPQETLNEIIREIRNSAESILSRSNPEWSWDTIATLFENLAEWLRKGGAVPCASGPIFGQTPMNVAYPGMICGAPPRTVPTNIKHVRSNSTARFRYAIMVADPLGEDFTKWVFVYYEIDGSVRQQWEFKPMFVCPGCRSVGFEISKLGPLQCSFCDGTEGGNPPDAK